MTRRPRRPWRAPGGLPLGRNTAKPAGHGSVTAVDPACTLYDVGTRDLWQVQVEARGGVPVGRVVRQIIEPRLYTVRYLIVFDPENGRRFLLPSNTITDIGAEGVVCNLDSALVALLPEFKATLERPDEEALYQAIGRTPHWVEEAPPERRSPGWPNPDARNAPPEEPGGPR